jgi:hypothetical protein
MAQGKSRVFSGVQPSGDLHLGNYLGAIQNWVALTETYDCIYCIVDLHAVTIPYQPEQLPDRIFEVAVGLLASGLEPNRCTLFVQSAVPEHAELAWLLNTVTPLGELSRMTQFKDKSDRVDTVNAGLLNYPILQAADILLYHADAVPVGEDQRQHLELTREIARRWNARFGEYFPEPDPDGGHGSGPRAPERPGRPRRVQRVQPARLLQPEGRARGDRLSVPDGGDRVRRLQAPPYRERRGRAGSDPGASTGAAGEP